MLNHFVDLEHARNDFWINGARLEDAAGRSWWTGTVSRLLKAGYMKRRKLKSRFDRALNIYGAFTARSYMQVESNWEYRITEAGYSALDREFPGWDGSAPQQAVPEPTAEASDVVVRLNELAALRDSGAVSTDEFEKLKQRLLG